MRVLRSVRFLAFAFALVLCACGAATESEEDLEKKYDALTRKFGQHVMREEWPAAYAMLSTALRDHFAEQEFADFILSHYEEYHEFGAPIDVGADYNTFDPSWIDRDDYNIPDYIPEDPRWLACTFANMVIEGTGDDPERCYHLALVWVRENGADRICDVEHGWCD